MDYQKIYKQAESLLFKSPKNALDLAEVAYKSALFSNDADMQAKILYLLGRIYSLKGVYSESLDYYEKAMSLVAEDDLNLKARILNSMGIIYKNKGDFKNSLNFTYEAINIGLKELNAGLYNNIATIYMCVKHYDKALEALNLSLEDAKLFYNESLIVTCYINIANVYSEKKQFARANTYYIDAYELSKKLNLIEKEASISLNLGYTSYRMEDYDKAEEHYTHALAINKKYAFTYRIVETQLRLGMLYRIQEKYTIAEEFLKLAFVDSKENGFVKLEIECLKELYLFNKNQHLFEKALHYADQLVELQSSYYEQQLMIRLYDAAEDKEKKKPKD